VVDYDETVVETVAGPVGLLPRQLTVRIFGGWFYPSDPEPVPSYGETRNYVLFDHLPSLFDQVSPLPPVEEHDRVHHLVVNLWSHPRDTVQ
jgi:hypothetical protein